ncbi:hypothetical protein [Pandoraea iniqua]|uniref:hypothetical protein n=1 Tax=Pandoraea iniqua TaxID=2508288 RepID=UPI00158175E0|nr:hypothetical protein [Pandoraea iniqua]
MMLLSLRRHALTVPAAILVAYAFSAPPVHAATDPAGASQASAAIATYDPANPDAPVGQSTASGVLHDFARPALSVPPGNWRAVNANVSGGGQMDHGAMNHAMPMPATPAASGAHAGHGTMTPSSATPPAAPSHTGHATMDATSPAATADPHAGHSMSGGTR